MLGNVAATSFLLAWTFPMDKSDKTMKKKGKISSRKGVMSVVYGWDQ